MSEELMHTEPDPYRPIPELSDLLSDLDTIDSEVSLIAKTVADNCTKSLDSYVEYIANSLSQVQSVSNESLDEFVLNLPIYIYYASSAVEGLGLKEDIANIVKKRKLAQTLDRLKASGFSGPANLRTATVDALLTNDSLVQSIYTSAYKTGKSKVDYAYEILASCKKVMSRRIEELKAYQSDTNRNTSNHNEGG